MGDENECILPISCAIQTEQDSIPEDDNMGPSDKHTLMDKLDKMDVLYLEVSGAMSNIDCAIPTEEDDRLLEEIRKIKAGKEKRATINWPAFSESPISEYGGKGHSVCCFHGCIPVGMAISMSVKLSILASKIGLESSCSWMMTGLRRIRCIASMP
jgi:hypothetical protein